MMPVLLNSLLLFIIYRSIIHSMETFKEGNKTGGIAILTVIPFVIFCCIYFQMYR
ncbi:hypothetical protein JCM21714_4614 [Gracilibacillus boraciitolerans JCM 21714]|uniref:Uncharacterized protein n=1 Tax=Gracilibacillus boraciitolerans JCM 21714 TaxID=1298598 RepID=W4VQ86_9BACI|nr:hypothetical protein [Gracilibacillus boraciitolerans]GAE95382.1 hypothetical protein JCM21714_4614 [Gracilibacillus boraciitolerans JCM 21714]